MGLGGILTLAIPLCHIIYYAIGLVWALEAIRSNIIWSLHHCPFSVHLLPHYIAMSNKAIVSANNWFERFTKGWSALSLSLVTSAVMAGGTLIAAWLLRLYHNKTIGFDRNEMDTKPFEMKPYQVHIFLGTGNTSWPKKFEHSDIGSRAQDVLASLPKSVPKCKISACDAPIGTVLVFPDRVMYDLSHEPTSNELSAILKSHLLKDIQNTT